MRDLPANAVFTPPIKQPLTPPVGLPGEPAEAAPASAAPQKTREKMAVLRFLQPDAVSKTYAVKHPFAYLDASGEEIEVREIPIRRLAVAEVGALCIGKNSENFDLFDFYASMTGLPPEVLRGMDADEEVVDECRPFLPRPIRELVELLSLPFGAATPSPPPNPAESPSDAS